MFVTCGPSMAIRGFANLCRNKGKKNLDVSSRTSGNFGTAKGVWQ
jgi:hypothetical protein